MKNVTTANASSVRVVVASSVRIVVKNVRVNASLTQRVVFRTRPAKGRVVCRTKGMPTLFVKALEDGSFQGHSAGTFADFVKAKTDDKCFAKAVSMFWA